MTSIDLSSIIPISEMSGDCEEDTSLLNGMALEAQAFIKRFHWCLDIKDVYFGFGVGGVVGVFLIQITPANIEIDEYIWVIVGDLPPAYIVTDDSRNPSEALESYIFEMRQWVNAVEQGNSVEELIPVNAPANLETVNMLKSRLGSLEIEILPIMRRKSEADSGS
jgi:hypothetical protein